MLCDFICTLSTKNTNAYMYVISVAGIVMDSNGTSMDSWSLIYISFCLEASQISEWYEHHNTQSHGFETPLDLAVGRLTAQWIEAQRYRKGTSHHDVIKWKHFPRYWRFVRGIHRSPVNSSHKGQWRGAFDVSLICALNKRLSKQSWGW